MPNSICVTAHGNAQAFACLFTHPNCATSRSSPIGRNLAFFNQFLGHPAQNGVLTTRFHLFWPRNRRVSLFLAVGRRGLDRARPTVLIRSSLSLTITLPVSLLMLQRKKRRQIDSERLEKILAAFFRFTFYGPFPSTKRRDLYQQLLPLYCPLLLTGTTLTAATLLR